MSHNLSSEMKVNSILTLQKNPFTKHSNEEKNNTNTDHGDWTEPASRMRCKSCLLLFFLIVISKSRHRSVGNDSEGNENNAV